MTTAAVPSAEKDTCPLCDSPRIHVARDPHPTWGPWRIDACDACGFHFTNPRPLPEALPGLYADLVFDALPDAGTLLGTVRRTRLAARLRRLWPKFPRGRLECADVGTGDGFFASVLAEQSECRRVVAADFFESTPRSLVGSSHVEYQHYDRFHASPDRFDVIFCRFVLEHVLDPRDFVARLAARLREGGVLVVEVPNWRAAWRRLLGPYYSELSLPMHLNHFEPKTLGRLFAGWTIESFEDQHGLVLAPSLGRVFGRPLPRTGALTAALLGVEFAVDRVLGPPPNMTAIARRTSC